MDTPTPDRPPVPDYELLRPIGKGSYGEVWLARSVTGVFRVIKIVRRDRFEDERPYLRELEGISRFQAAASGRPRQLALLHVGRNDAAGYFYYVMEPADDVEAGSAIDPDRYVPLTLKELRARRGRLPAAECVQLVLELARGLAILHGAGLIHRDIKPSNIIFVQRVPKLADVGLVTSSEATLTCAGTPGYAPPEGAGNVTADIYSLGKVLYEIASGCDRMEFPRLPPDLADDPDTALLGEINAIVLRACHPDPRERHGSAEALARDLEIIQAGRSVAFYEALRRRLRAAALAAVLVAILAGGGAAMFLWRSRVLQSANDQARRALYRSDLAVAQLARSSGDFGRARAALQRQVPGPGEPDLRGLEWSILHHAVRGDGDPLEPAAQGVAVQQIAADSSGRWVAASFADNRAAIWDLGTRRLVRRLENVQVLGGFTRDGLLVVDETNRALRFESPTQGTVGRRETGQRLGAYIPPSRTYYLPPVDALQLTTWELSTNLDFAPVPLGQLWPNSDVSALEISPDNSKAIISTYQEEGAQRTRMLTLIQLNDLSALWSTNTPAPTVWIRWSPDNKWLLLNVGGLNPTAILDGSPRPRFTLRGHTARVHDAAFSIHGDLIATASADQTIRIWNSLNGESINTLFGLGRPATAVAWAPNGKLIIAGDDQGNLRAFNHPNQPQVEILRGVFSDVHGDITPSDDGRFIAITKTTNSISVFDTESLEHSKTLTNVFQPVAFYGSNGYILALSSAWDLHSIALSDSSRRRISASLPKDFSVTCISQSPSRTRTFFGDKFGRYALLEWNTGAIVTNALTHQTPIWAAAPAPSAGEFWLASEAEGIIRLDDQTAKPHGPRIHAPGDPQALAVSPDSKWLAVALYNDSSIRILDLDLGMWLEPRYGHRRFVQCLLFTSDGKRLVSAGADGKVVFWRAPDLEEVASFEIEPADELTGDEGICSLKLFPKEDAIGALTEDGRLKLWRGTPHGSSVNF